MNWLSLIGLISTFAFLVPILVIAALRLFTNKSFLAIGAYYLFAFVYNLMTTDLWQVSAEVKKNVRLFNHFLDTPLILIFLLLLTQSPKIANQIKVVIGGYFACELMLAVIFRYNPNSIAIGIGIGFLINICYCGYFFYRQLCIAILYPKKIARSLMTGSLLFTYGCYGLIYLFYFVMTNPNARDVFTLFYVFSTIFSLVMTAGLYMEGKKFRSMQTVRNSYGDEEFSLEENKKRNIFHLAFLRKSIMFRTKKITWKERRDTHYP